MSDLRKAPRRAGQLLLSGARAFVMLPVSIGRAIASQTRGTWANVRGFVGWLSIDRALPPAVASTLKWLGGILPQAFGAGSSYEQTAASGVLILGAISATVLTFGLTAAIVVAMIPFLFIGMWRFVPVVNTFWKRGRRKITSRDGSLPRWDR
ncbi:hypothetical protein [Natrialba asiatica]|nr:hypothetical protein [Natrialba asiatica]